MSVQEARARLDSYLAECWLKREALDHLKLRHLEDDLIAAGRREVTPF
jgi:hypothetical protein